MTAHELRRSANGATKEPLADFTGQGTILLVEDEQSLRSLIARGLRSRGYS
jgi:two-component system, cell cycle sensor histidine kinase and response regulator CckA